MAFNDELSEALVAATTQNTNVRHVPVAVDRHTIAHYLPQFHAIPENDEWYGAGFTEWTNVRRSKPLTLGHRPIQPGDLGWYSLDSTDVMFGQQALAERYGVTSFAFWHYWFGGRRVLEKPAELLLADPSLLMRFSFFWANESWKGTWYGAPKKTLISQEYPVGDAARHFESMTAFFADPRYVRVGGKLLLGIYRPHLIPDVDQYVDVWRTRAEQLGLGELFILGQAEGDFEAPDCCDASWTNPLKFSTASAPIRRQLSHLVKLPWAIDANRLAGALEDFYRSAPLRTVPTVMANWDNTPRAHRRGSYLIRNSESTFAKQCAAALELDDRRVRSGHDSILLVKSWNEWAEGNSLEPSEEHGHSFGDALAATIAQKRSSRSN